MTFFQLTAMMQCKSSRRKEVIYVETSARLLLAWVLTIAETSPKGKIFRACFLKDGE